LWENEPCRAACPVHTDAGAYVTAIAEGRHRDAYLIARAPNPFPSICGRVCAAPCEEVCRRGKIDSPIAIRVLKRFVTERFGVESFAASSVWHEAHGPVPPATAPSVGIVGSGPAGLSAAHDLRLAGHAVTVYEGQHRPGGMMVLGIPEYRLARGLISREIDAIVELGVELRTGCRVGADITIDELLGEHAAVLLAVGTGQGRDLELPGHELDGVLRAVEFLLNVNQGFRVDLGERVVVVGGGNVAFDAARTSLRASSLGARPPAPVALGPGARADARRGVTTTLDVARAAVRAGVGSVTVIALESPAEIPAAPEEIDEAEGEGIEIVYRRGPHRFLGNGRVAGLETIAVASVFDDQGRFAPTFIPDTEQIVPADTVILAVGQTSDLGFLDVGAPDFEHTPRGDLAVDHTMLRTSHPRVWAAGDMAFGPRNLIDAIADGQRVARNIHATLTGGGAPAVGEVRVEISARPGYRRLATGYDGIDRVAIPMVPTARRVGFAEVEMGYDEEAAVLESLRCLRCFDNIMLRTELCILCGLCVDVCPYDCISVVRADHAGVGAASQSALLLDEELCIRCGLCVNRCPPGALVMVHAQEPAHG
jgi:NADPH-dependent glutamate synthase beta subunit-like oxidoreductase/ferredoxin